MRSEKSSILPHNWDVPQIFRDRLGSTAGAQRAMLHDGHLLLILHEVPARDGGERDGLFFWRDPSGSWRTSRGGGNTVPLVQLLDRYAAAIDALERDLAAATSADALFRVLRASAPLARAAGNLAYALQQAREGVSDREIIALRDRGLELQRAAELVSQSAKHALDYAIARQSEAQSRAGNELARSAARLNRLAAVFLPLTLVASLFGMNLPNGIDTDSPLLFWGLVAGGLVMGFLLGRMVQPRERAQGSHDAADAARGSAAIVARSAA
jgi:hypothetical protein